MKTHPYLRAYMAGITVPTAFLVVVVSGLTFATHHFETPVPLERFVVFPMAGVPNLWGLWNMLYLRRHAHGPVSIGVHGALLPLILAPVGFLLARLLEISFVTPALFLTLVAPVLAIYYLVWKHLVNFLNELLGIA